MNGFWIYFSYNFFFYVVPFFIGLHFTYLDYMPFLQGIVLTREELKKLKFLQWVLLAVGSIIILVLIGFHFYLFYISEKYLYFGIGYGFFFISCFIYWIAIRKTTVIHLHHYQIGAFFIAFTPFQNIISAICQGIVTGLYVEGISRWGMHPLFKRKH